MKRMLIISAVLLLFSIGGCGLIGQVLDGDGMERTEEQIAAYNARKETEEEAMDPMAIPTLRIGEDFYTIDFESNSSADAFFEKIKKEPLSIDMHDYGQFEKVGDLPWDIPTNDEEITTKPGDIILYQGNKITIYYDENTWNFTKIGSIRDITEEELKESLGEGDVTVEFSVEWTE